MNSIEKRKLSPRFGRRSTKAGSRQGDVQRNRILMSATEYFAERGFDGSTHVLAKSIGVSQSLLYHYYSQKEDLVLGVYNRLFTNRWKPEWDEIFTDPSLDARAKIKKFYISYYRHVLNRPWTRIFLFGALKGLDIHKKNFDVVREKVFPMVISELRQSKGLAPSSDLSDREVEIAWNLHATIFYLAIRRWVLRLRGRFSAEESISFSIDLFLDGATHMLQSDIKQD